MVGIAPVGDAPVPVMTVGRGRRLVVASSNRFAGRGEPQSLTVLDTAKIRQGLAAVQGIVPAGAFLARWRFRRISALYTVARQVVLQHSRGSCGRP